jgi:hypothetical protein
VSRAGNDVDDLCWGVAPQSTSTAWSPRAAGTETGLRSASTCSGAGSRCARHSGGPGSPGHGRAWPTASRGSIARRGCRSPGPGRGHRWARRHRAYMKQPGAMIFAYRKFLFFSRAADIKLRDPLTELGVRRDKICPVSPDLARSVRPTARALVSRGPLEWGTSGAVASGSYSSSSVELVRRERTRARLDQGGRPDDAHGGGARRPPVRGPGLGADLPSTTDGCAWWTFQPATERSTVTLPSNFSAWQVSGDRSGPGLQGHGGSGRPDGAACRGLMPDPGAGARRAGELRGEEGSVDPACRDRR